MPKSKGRSKRGITKLETGQGTATVPIMREKYNEDDLAAKALRMESKKRYAPKQGKKFNPQSNQKYR